MRKLKLILIITSILLVFVSCKKNTEVDQEKIKEYPVTINYTYDCIYYISGKADINNFSNEFTGYANDIKIKEITENTIIVSSIISNDYFTTNEIEVAYTYTNNDNNFTITDAKCNDIPVVKPVLAFNLDILYQKNLQMKINNKEIELTKENFKEIEFDIKGEKTDHTCSESEFSKSGVLFLTTLENEKYYTYVHITYNPYEHEDWTKEASWSLNKSHYYCYRYEE